MILRGKASKLTIADYCGLPGLRRTLLACAERDQHARAVLAGAMADRPDEHLGPNNPTRQRIAEVDTANLLIVESLIAQHGWLGANLVDVDGAHACWILVQHMPPRHRIAYLPLMIRAAAAGHASTADLAHLHDRVAVDRRRPQAFGTQSLASFSPRRLWPTESGVNVRRATAGLPPLSTGDLAAIWAPGDLRRVGIITRDRCC